MRKRESIPFVGKFVGTRTWAAERLSQVIGENGGDDETRTRDLCRDRAAF
jgi:hypothetical protein